MQPDTLNKSDCAILLTPSKSLNPSLASADWPGLACPVDRRNYALV